MSEIRRPSAIALLLVLLAAGGCGKSDVTNPGTGLEVNNAADDFQYQVTGVRNYSHVHTYTWQNTGTAATVNQATTITGGAATLVLVDGAGTQVYSRTLADNGTYQSAAGAAGAWTIRLTYSDASADAVNFRVQKMP